MISERTFRRYIDRYEDEGLDGLMDKGTASSFQGMSEVIERRGLPSSLYTDRGSHYWHTPEAGGKVDRDNPTAVRARNAPARRGDDPHRAPPPVRRVNIPKPDGGTRPLGVAALQDKIVQKAVVDVVLTPIYEADFLGFSYGFRPGRGAHDAFDALAYGIEKRKVSWIRQLDVDTQRTDQSL